MYVLQSKTTSTRRCCTGTVSDNIQSPAHSLCFFLEPTSVHVSNYPDHYEPKIFFGFQSPHLPFDEQFWTRGFPYVMRSRKAAFPLATGARKREFCLQSYVSRITLDENFLSQKFSNFFWNPDHYEPKIFFWFSKSAPTLR